MKQAYKKYGVISIVICLTVLSLLYMLNNKDEEYEFTTSQVAEDQGIGVPVEEIDLTDVFEEDIEAVEIIKAELVPVYICGEVNNPDVYYLDSTTIIKDAIMTAGGFTEAADLDAWNLAMEIQKGEKIYVPKVGEQIDKIGNSYDNRVRSNGPSNTDRERININSANNQELTSLPGIGITIAQNIIDYREANGEFKSLQDVMNVSRIGQGTLDKIKDYICFQ